MSSLPLVLGQLIISRHALILHRDLVCSLASEKRYTHLTVLFPIQAIGQILGVCKLIPYATGPELPDDVYASLIVPRTSRAR